MNMLTSSSISNALDTLRDNALTYGRTPSSPASISPVDIDKWKATVEPTFKHYFTEKYDAIAKEYEQLLREYQVNKLLYESAMGFQPIIGNIYYLYTKKDNTTFISLVEPSHAFWSGYVGAFKLNAQYTWVEVLYESKYREV